MWKILLNVRIQKWPARREFEPSSPRSGLALSIDWPLFWARSHVFNYPGLLMLGNGVILHNNWIWFVIIDLLKSYAISHNPDQVSLLKKWCIINKVVLQNNFHFQQNLHKRNASRTVFRIWVLIFQQGCAVRKILGIQMLWTWNPACPAYYLHAKTDWDFLVTHSKSQAPGHSGCC